MKKLHPTVSVATVYKTLRILKELRLVQELPLSQGETRFDSNVSPHLNVLCLQCGTVSDVNDQTIRNVVGRAASRIKFTVTAQRFDVYGLCEKCARKNRSIA